jgi:hypothetical protein
VAHFALFQQWLDEQLVWDVAQGVLEVDQSAGISKAVKVLYVVSLARI